MAKTEIAALLAGAPVALASAYARDLLAVEMPEAGTAAGAAVGAGGTRLTAGPDVERFTVQRGVAVVPVRGLLTPNSEMLERWLGWTTYFGLGATMAELAERADVAAIVLDIDSPGGLVLGCAGAAAAVAAAAAAKPVLALAAPMAASAAYWLATQATSISVVPGGIVGSVGVALMAASFVGPDRNGAQWVEMASTHARAKRPDPGTEEGRAELQRSLDENEALFHAAVAAGRGIELAELPARLSVTDDPRDGGAVYSGTEAIGRGLADSAETRAAFYDRVFGAYGAAQKTAPSARYSARARAARALAGI